MSTRRRRARFGAMTIVLVVAAAAALVLANVLAQRFARRVDVTATREHELSPRSNVLLGKLRGSFEIVIAAPLRDPRAVDRRALSRLADVLDQFKRASSLAAGSSVQISLIDTASAQGATQYSALLERLRERDRAKIDKQIAAVSSTQAVAEGLAAWLEGASPRLVALKDEVPTDAPAGGATRTYLERRAGECRTSAAVLKDLVGRSRTSLHSGSAAGIPDTEGAAGVLRQPLTDLEIGLRDIAQNLDLLSKDTGFSQSVRDSARTLSVEAGRERDRCAVASDTLERMPRLDITRIARLLQGATAAILIGPAEVGVTAIDLRALLPSAAAINATGGADLGRNAEELIATALAALAQPVKPIVIIVHGQPRGFFDRNKVFEAATQRLAVRGIDVLIWEAAVNVDPPSTSRLDPIGNRPVVYVCFSVDSPSGGTQGQTGPERAQKLGKALNWIVDTGHPLLLSMFPSTLPTFGEADPTVAFLTKFGLRADTARPLLHETVKPTGREVQAIQVVRATESDHPIARAIKGLPTRLQWPIPMRVVDTKGVKVSTIYEINDPSVWGESQWLTTLMQVPIEQHATVPNPPSNDSDRDDPKGPWILGAAAERDNAGRPQRLVAIGSNTWFSDPILKDMTEVDGRPVAASPGNAELFDAAVSWLAGQDDLIAQSPTARAIPLIGPMSGTTRTALRLLSIVGLPSLVLLAGLVWRVVRG
jgi:hypothetical protein